MRISRGFRNSRLVSPSRRSSARPLAPSLPGCTKRQARPCAPVPSFCLLNLRRLRWYPAPGFHERSPSCAASLTVPIASTMADKMIGRALGVDPYSSGIGFAVFEANEQLELIDWGLKGIGRADNARMAGAIESLIA